MRSAPLASSAIPVLTHHSLERGPCRRHRVAMLSSHRATGERHLRDHRRAAVREDEVVIRIRLALYLDEPGLDAEDARLERAAGVLAARGGPEGSEVANGRGP